MKDSELSVTVLRKRTGKGIFSLQACRLNEPVTYKQIIVPANYETNFGSIPFGFRWLIRPFHWRSMKCYVVHDYCCEKAENYEQRKLADKTLIKYLKSRGYWWRLPLIYIGIRLGAFYWYIKN